MKLVPKESRERKSTIRGKLVATIMMTSFSVVAVAANPDINKCPPQNPDCNDPPPWLTYCQSITTLVQEGVPCTAATYAAGIRYGTKSTITQPASPAYTAAGWGNSHAAVATNFGAVQLANFQSNAAIDSQMTNIDPATMAQLSVELWRLAPSDVPDVYIAAAQRLSAANLAKMRAAFGTTMDAYIADYAPATVLQQYSVITPYSALPFSHYSGTPFPPSSDMTYTDLYLNAYTSGQNQNQQVSVQKAVAYGQFRFRDKSILTTLGRSLMNPEGVALAWLFSVATSADPEWASQLVQAGKDMLAACEAPPYCGYRTYIPNPALPPPIVVPLPVPESVPPDPDPTSEDVPVPESGGGNRDSVPFDW
jgi:hypothetical protein